MNHKEKKEILKKLSEKEFRQDIIIPLLSKMGFIAPIEYHGTNERGKDIICFEYDKLNEQRFLSIVAKTGDMTGDVSSDKGLMNIVNQVQQAFDKPYEDLFNMKQVLINEVWIMTTGRIISGAEESVISTLRKYNLDKRIRFIRVDRLIQLIDSHFGTFWNSSTETKESVIIQRDRLITFIVKLLQSNNVDKGTIESVKSTILYSDYSPSITKNIDGLHISSVSPFSIELSKIDEDYDDYIFSNNFGITKDIFAETKKYLSYSFFDIEETMDHAERVSKITNPEEFVIESYKYLADNYPFWNSYSGDPSKFIDNLSYLEEGLRELKYFKKYLKHLGKFEWAKELSKSIPKLLPEVQNIIENCKQNEVEIHFIILESEKKICIEYDNKNSSICFSTKHKLIDKKSHDRNTEGLIKASSIIDSALSKFRLYLDKTLNYNEEEWMQNYVDEL